VRRRCCGRFRHAGGGEGKRRERRDEGELASRKRKKGIGEELTISLHCPPALGCSLNTSDLARSPKVMMERRLSKLSPPPRRFDLFRRTRRETKSALVAFVRPSREKGRGEARLTGTKANPIDTLNRLLLR